MYFQRDFAGYNYQTNVVGQIAKQMLLSMVANKYPLQTAPYPEGGSVDDCEHP
jgi:hypothetical protein